MRRRRRVKGGGPNARIARTVTIWALQNLHVKKIWWQVKKKSFRVWDSDQLRIVDEQLFFFSLSLFFPFIFCSEWIESINWWLNEPKSQKRCRPHRVSEVSRISRVENGEICRLRQVFKKHLGRRPLGKRTESAIKSDSAVVSSPIVHPFQESFHRWISSSQTCHVTVTCFIL